MRLVAGVFALSVLSSLARADAPAEPAPPPAVVAATTGPVAPRAKIPLRLVRVLPESHQALLYDRERSTHVLVEAGGSVEGYTVDAIDDDEVALSRDGKLIVLAAGMTPIAPAPAAPIAAPVVTPAAAPVPHADPAPLDPYGDASAPAPAVRVAESPDAAPVRVVESPDAAPVRVAEAPTAAPVRVAEAPDAATPSPAVPAAEAPPPARRGDAPSPTRSTEALPPAHGTEAAAAPLAPAAAPPAAKPAAAHASSGSRTSAAATGPIVLARSDVDAALANFGALGAQVSATFSPAGLVLERVGDGTIFERAGLRSGDVVASIDGTRLASLDDAATLYAKLSDAHALTAQIVRDGKPITLHLAIQ